MILEFIVLDKKGSAEYLENKESQERYLKLNTMSKF